MPDFFAADDLGQLLETGQTAQLNENTSEVKENEVDGSVGHGRNVAATEPGTDGEHLSHYGVRCPSPRAPGGSLRPPRLSRGTAPLERNYGTLHHQLVLAHLRPHSVESSPSSGRPWVPRISGEMNHELAQFVDRNFLRAECSTKMGVHR